MDTDTSMSSDYMNGGGDKKRKRTCSSNGKSEVWMHFTEIRTTDRGVVYAVCHCCDRGYNGDSRNGTSHLKRHNKKCSSMRQEMRIMVSMLHGKQKSGHCSYSSKTMEV